MTKMTPCFALLLALAACSPKPPDDAFAADAASEVVAEDTGSEAAVLTSAPPPPEAARTAEALDTTTIEQRAEAASAPVAEATSLGTTIVSLGSPTEPGFWLKTPLVKAEIAGRVTNPATGKSSLVTLIPIDGPETAGSRLSLPAMRLIEASLTDLTEVEVALEG